MKTTTASAWLPRGLSKGTAVAAVLAFLLVSWLSLVPSEACSSFVLDNGSTLFGTNYDSTNTLCLLFFNVQGQVKDGYSATQDGRKLHWISRYASITFNAGGYQLPWAGMNEQGLMLSTMALDETDPPDPDERLPIQFGAQWMQYVLDTCATVEDVISTDATIRIVDTPDHYLVADRSGTAAVIELLDGEMVVYTGAGLPIKALANDPYQETLAVWLDYLDAGTGDCEDVPPLHQRFCNMAEQTLTFEPTDSDAAVAYAFDLLDTVGSSSYTQWSIVFDTSNFRVHFRTLTEHETRYLDLSDFAVACPAQVQMAELHSLPTGNVGGAFFDLSIAMCLDHTLSYLEYSGSDVPVEFVEQLVQHTAGFTCKGLRRASHRIGH